MSFESYSGDIQENQGERLNKDEAVEKETTILERFRKGSHAAKLFFAMMTLSTNMAFGQADGTARSSEVGTNTVNVEQTQNVKRQWEDLAKEQEKAKEIQKENERISKMVESISTANKDSAAKVKKVTEDLQEDLKKRAEDAKRNPQPSPSNSSQNKIDEMMKKVKDQEKAAYGDFKAKTGVDVNDILKVFGGKADLK